MVGYSLNPVIHLLFQLIIGPEHNFVHIFSDITLDFSYCEKIFLSKFSSRKHTGMLICLTLEGNIFASKIEIQLMIYSLCTILHQCGLIRISCIYG